MLFNFESDVSNKENCILSFFIFILFVIVVASILLSTICFKYYSNIMSFAVIEDIPMNVKKLKQKERELLSGNISLKDNYKTVCINDGIVQYINKHIN